jgi:hypothetical protein
MLYYFLAWLLLIYIFTVLTRVARYFLVNYTKTRKILQLNTKCMYQMVITLKNIFQSKAFQNLPKYLGYLVCKQTIWQPWFQTKFVEIQSRSPKKTRIKVQMSYVDSVTRMGEFLPVGQLFSLGQNIKNYISSPNFLLLFYRGKSYAFVFGENGLGYILGNYVSKTHLVTLHTYVWKKDDRYSIEIKLAPDVRIFHGVTRRETTEKLDIFCLMESYVCRYVCICTFRPTAIQFTCPCMYILVWVKKNRCAVTEWWYMYVIVNVTAVRNRISRNRFVLKLRSQNVN